MRDNYECGMHGYVKGGHNYATASLDRILFDCLPRNLWWSWLRRRLVETRQNMGERQRRNRIERERVEENGQGEAKFTGSVCRERRPPWRIEREREQRAKSGEAKRKGWRR